MSTAARADFLTGERVPPGPPAFPALCQGLAIVPTEDGVLIEGGPRRQRLAGGAAAALLTRVLASLDGKRRPEQIRASLGLTAGQLDHVLGVLGGCGLLEHGGEDDSGTGGSGEPDQPGDVLAYLSRTLGVTGVHQSTGEAFGALRESAVILIGGSPALELISTDLRASGVGTVTRVSDPGTLAVTDLAPPARHGRKLVVAYDDGARSGTLERAVSACAAAALPVLRIAAGRDHADIGPVFRPGYTACPRCLRRGIAEAGWDQSGADDDPAGPGLWLLAGLATGEIIAAITRVGVPASPRQLTRVQADGYRVGRRLVAPYPDCASCAGPGPVAGPEWALAATYEWQMCRRLDETGLPGDPSADEQARLHRLQTLRPAYPTAPRRPLPARDPAATVPGTLGRAGAGPAAFDVALLAGILSLAAGRRDAGAPAESNRRWAPSGGNLGSPAVYVITGRPLADLPGNCLRYDDLAHSLVAFRSGTVPISDVLAGTDLAPGGLAAALIFTADVGRLALKYKKFAYRLAHLDAGCAAAQLAAVATAHGLAVSFARSWDGRLAELLELDRDTELVTVVAGLRVTREDRPCP